ncbi:MAG: cytochrome d ubiquinol oxidase subunit II [Raoultibacter sp.]
MWFILIFVLIAGYFVLDGFDLGAGALYPFIAKNEKEKAIVRRSVGPVWDGNEVWLLTAGGALFAAFAPAYATTFSGFYLAIMLVLFGLIVRAVSLEFRAHDPQWGRAWDICFFVGSLLPALLFGVAVGNIYAGIPMDANGDYSGLPLIGLITPFTLLCGLLGLSIFLSQGATWVSLKAPKPSEVRDRAAKLRFPLQIIALVLFLAVSLYAHFIIQPTMDPALGFVRWLFAILFVVALIASIVLVKKKDCDLGAFIASCVSAVCLVGLLASSMFPNLVVATDGTTITLMSAASSELALMWMTIITCIGLPLVLVYHVIIYRTFRGRVTDEDIEHY